MSRQLVLPLNTETAEKYYFIEHTEDLNVCLGCAGFAYTDLINHAHFTSCTLGCSLLTFDISELVEYLVNGCRYFPNILCLDTY